MEIPGVVNFLVIHFAAPSPMPIRKKLGYWPPQEDLSHFEGFGRDLLLE